RDRRISPDSGSLFQTIPNDDVKVTFCDTRVPVAQPSVCDRFLLDDGATGDCFWPEADADAWQLPAKTCPS
ncbi:hypothetical protein, partial [Stutzerimonas kunmingensis]|uniref:hypothetical protein n=1 Tax=Stutzerimonas kunmingensis TaxID=1211807 RepID=UPI0028AA28B0